MLGCIGIKCGLCNELTHSDCDPGYFECVMCKRDICYDCAGSYCPNCREDMCRDCTNQQWRWNIQVEKKWNNDNVIY